MKILIADDHAMFRDALALRLEQAVPEAVVFQAPGYSQLFKMLKYDSAFDLLMLGNDDGDMSLKECAARIGKEYPQIKTAVLSAQAQTAHDLQSAGVCGFIPQNACAKTLGTALRQICGGGLYYTPAPHDAENSSSAGSTHKALTARQSQVLDLIAQGKSNKQIAFDMGVSESTVKLHINALLRSLHVSNRTQAVITAQKIGLI